MAAPTVYVFMWLILFGGVGLRYPILEHRAASVFYNKNFRLDFLLFVFVTLTASSLNIHLTKLSV